MHMLWHAVGISGVADTFRKKEMKWGRSVACFYSFIKTNSTMGYMSRVFACVEEGCYWLVGGGAEAGGEGGADSSTMGTST